MRREVVCAPRDLVAYAVTVRCICVVCERVDLLTDVEGHQKGVKLSYAHCMILS
jgi:hypothetical protein